jgi:hypothetical protein
MARITHVNVEHDGQSWFGTEIPSWWAGSDEHAAQGAVLIVLREINSAPGRVTRVEFTYEGDEDA